MTATAQRWHVPMRGRDPDEPHRASTPLELFFDLCFVVAVAQAGIALHHELADGHVAEGVIGYLMVFFAIWWAWMNFTWFASAFDTDDVLYRLLTFVQIAGALVIAAGVERAFTELDYTVLAIGYLIMRLGLIAQWVRAAREHPRIRGTALRFAGGVAAIQAGWLLRLAMPEGIGNALFVPFVAIELAIPIWAERAGGPTPWHGGHIAERYGLFTIIVLGESVLAASTALQEAFGARGLSLGLVTLAAGALVLIGSMWWAYFKHNAAEEGDLRETSRQAFMWGYGHYFVFSSAAAVGAGLQVAADLTHEEAAVGPMFAALAIAIPTAVYLLAGWLVNASGRSWRAVSPVLVTAGLLLAIAVIIGSVNVPLAALAMGVLVAVTVGLSAYRRSRAAPREREALLAPSVDSQRRDVS
jgi:low temperature requirement protein LtrA